jgi:hypothetical protein
MQKDEKARPLVLANKHAVAYDGDSLLYVSPAAETLVGHFSEPHPGLF